MIAQTTSEENKQIIRAFIETWNTHDISTTLDLLDPDIAFRSPLFSSPVRGLEARRGVDENFLTSMPDFEFKLIAIAAAGDFVATELTGSGTSTGPAKLPGRDPIPPTGRHVEFGMAGFFRVTSEGKIAEERYYYDRLDLIQQLSPATTAAPGHSTQAATASWGGDGSVRANERVVEAFLQDVINEHHGDHAINYLNPDMQWSGGTVGTVTGSANVAGLFASVVAAFPDVHITIDGIFGQGDQVVVRVVVSGTQESPILGIPASGRHVQWDGVDIYRLSDGKISNIWAGDDWTAILNDTGTFKAPWIP